MIHVGIDLGTTNTLACTKDGIIFNQPSAFKPTKPSDYNFKVDMHTSHELPINNSVKILNEVYNTLIGMYGKEEFEVVVTVPAYFTSPQREATRIACARVGFNNIRLITEPTASAYYYDLDNVIVFDVGGGTYDISYVKDSRVIVSDGGIKGGKDVDSLIASSLMNKENKPMFERTPFYQMTKKQEAKDMKERNLIDKDQMKAYYLKVFSEALMLLSMYYNQYKFTHNPKLLLTGGVGSSNIFREVVLEYLGNVDIIKMTNTELDMESVAKGAYKYSTQDKLPIEDVINRIVIVNPDYSIIELVPAYTVIPCSIVREFDVSNASRLQFSLHQTNGDYYDTTTLLKEVIIDDMFKEGQYITIKLDCSGEGIITIYIFNSNTGKDYTQEVRI